jgi:hypothetical protein
VQPLAAGVVGDDGPGSARDEHRAVRVAIVGTVGGECSQRRQCAHESISTCTIPENTRRSSTRATPRILVGSNGSDRANCASLNQNSLILMLTKFESVNHKPSGDGIPLYASGAKAISAEWDRRVHRAFARPGMPAFAGMTIRQRGMTDVSEPALKPPRVD